MSTTHYCFLKSSSVSLILGVLIILSGSEIKNYFWILKKNKRCICCLSNNKYAAFCCCAAVEVCLSGEQKGTPVLWVLLCPWTCPYLLLVNQCWRWFMRFLYRLAQLDSEVIHIFQELTLVKRTGPLLMSRLPKLHQGHCPRPLFGKGLWQWFSKLLRLVSVRTKSWQESELYRLVQQSFLKTCYKIWKKWSNFKRKWIIGATAARCWQACENWGVAWQILLNHSLCEWKKHLELKNCLPSHRISLTEDYFLLYQPKMNSWLSREVLLW